MTSRSVFSLLLPYPLCHADSAINHFHAPLTSVASNNGKPVAAAEKPFDSGPSNPMLLTESQPCTLLPQTPAGVALSSGSHSPIPSNRLKLGEGK